MGVWSKRWITAMTLTMSTVGSRQSAVGSQQSAVSTQQSASAGGTHQARLWPAQRTERAASIGSSWPHHSKLECVCESRNGGVCRRRGPNSSTSHSAAPRTGDGRAVRVSLRAVREV